MPSTVIDLFNYDHHTATLKIIFRSGNAYAYKNVPEEVFAGLKAAPSKGQYFNSHIKHKYAFNHLHGSDSEPSDF